MSTLEDPDEDMDCLNSQDIAANDVRNELSTVSSILYDTSLMNSPLPTDVDVQ